MQVKHPFKLDVPDFSHQIIDGLCIKAVEAAYERAALQKIPEHSCKYLTDTSRNILKMFVEPVSEPPRMAMDDEPRCLQSDNFMPSTVGVVVPPPVVPEKSPDKDQASRNSLRKRYSSNLASSNRTPANGEKVEVPKKKQQENPVSDQMVALEGVQNEEEDRIVKFLRQKKLADEKQVRALQESNKKQSQQKKQTKEKKPIPVTYDYNGEVIKIKNAEPANLVKGSLQSVVDVNIQLNSERGKTQRETIKLNNAANKLGKEQKKKKWAEAADESGSDDERQTPLIDLPIETFDLPEGAKITTLNRTNEKMRRQLNSRELMENYKNIKLSRSEYQKIRKIEQNLQAGAEVKNNTSIDKKLQQTIQEDHKVKRRSISMAAFKPHHEKVIVSNEELKQAYLNHPQQDDDQANALMITQPTRQTFIERDQQVEFLMKKQQPFVQGLNRTKTLLVLPEIKHKLGHATLIAHKARQRIRNQKEMLVQIHRKFEQRLRVSDSPAKN